MSETATAARQEPTVSVLVPTYQRPDALDACLNGLSRQSLPPTEILVVVRPADVASRKVVAQQRSLPVREVQVYRPGVVAARNKGLEAAIGDIVAFIDDDAVPHEDWLARLIKHYETPEVGAVGGRDIIFRNGIPISESPRHDVGILHWYGRFVSMHHRGSGPARDVDFLKGVNMSFRRAENPDLRVDQCLRGKGAEVHEETSICLQLRRRGFRVVYDPAILVDHFEADRGDHDSRAPTDLRARRDRQHNQTFIVVRYYPAYRALAHLVFAILVGMSEAPGFAVTLRNILRTRSFRGHLIPLLANVQGRVGGTRTALKEKLGSLRGGE